MKETTTCNLAAQGNPILGGIESEEEDHHLGLHWPSSLPTQVSSHSHWGTTSSRAPPPPLLSWETPAGEAVHPGTGPGAAPTQRSTQQSFNVTPQPRWLHLLTRQGEGKGRQSAEGQDWVDATRGNKCKECAS